MPDHSEKGKDREGEPTDSGTQGRAGASDSGVEGEVDSSKPVDVEADSQVTNPNRRWNREDLYEERLKRRK